MGFLPLFSLCYKSCSLLYGMTSNEKRKYQRLLALFMLFLLLFNYPLLSTANWPVLAWGIPLLYLYLFGVWLLMIILLAWAVHYRSTKNDPDE